MIDHLRRRYRHLADLARDARAATELSRLDLGFHPATAAALRPAALLQILADIVINRRRFVVELGSGLSTLYMARVLADHGGHLVAIEDDPDWRAIVAETLDRAGLTATVTLVDAPPAPCRHALDGLDWYDTDAIVAALDARRIDLLLVDGPKAFDAPRRRARYPAWPVLGALMAPRAAIALDDADRPGEQDLLARWQADPAFDFELQPLAAGMVMATRGLAFTTRI